MKHFGRVGKSEKLSAFHHQRHCKVTIYFHLETRLSLSWARLANRKTLSD